MGFNAGVRAARRGPYGPAYRYMALRRCVERFCPDGFQATWASLEAACLKPGQGLHDDDSLDVMLARLLAWRQIWLAGLHADVARRLAAKRKPGPSGPKGGRVPE